MKREGEGVEVGLVGKGQMTQGLADQVKEMGTCPKCKDAFLANMINDGSREERF